jgi:hypothetical protein
MGAANAQSSRLVSSDVRVDCVGDQEWPRISASAMSTSGQTLPIAAPTDHDPKSF